MAGLGSVQVSFTTDCGRKYCREVPPPTVELVESKAVIVIPWPEVITCCIFSLSVGMAIGKYLL